MGVEITRDNKRVVSVSQNMKIFLWDVASGAINREAVDRARFGRKLCTDDFQGDSTNYGNGGHV